MCGRYLFFDDRNEKIRELIEAAEEQLPEKEFRELSFFEVFPDQKILAGIYDHRKEKFITAVMTWGYRAGRKLIINARSETAETSAFFSGSHRAVIPACGYYEWSKNPRQKYYFTAEKRPIYLACLCRREQDGLRAVILTEDAGEPESRIHDRQPVLFTLEDSRRWCAGEDYKRMLSASLDKRIMEKV